MNPHSATRYANCSSSNMDLSGSSASRVSRKSKSSSALLADSEVSKTILSTGVDCVGGYTIGKTLGEGSFGKVKAGVHNLTGVPVAIKIVDKIHAPSVVREVETWRQMHHRHIAQLYEVITTESKIHMVMEYCSGGEAFDYIVKNGKISEESGQAQSIFSQIVEAVGYCHSHGFVHRDLKLENILLNNDGQVKLIDFGFTRDYTRQNLLQTYCGSLAYAAPEMICGTKYSGPCADVWSLGVILYSLVCGHLPFDDKNEAVIQKQILALDYSIPETVSPKCRDLIQKILVLNPIQRLTLPHIMLHPWLECHLPVPASTFSSLELQSSFATLGKTPSFKALSSNSVTATLSPGVESKGCNLADLPGNLNQSNIGLSVSNSHPPGAPDMGKSVSKPSFPTSRLLQQHVYSFSSTDDIVLITALQTIGCDVASIMNSVSLNLCDSNSALWYLLKYKREVANSKLATSQLHLHIHPPMQASVLFNTPNPLDSSQRSTNAPETGCIGVPKQYSVDSSSIPPGSHPPLPSQIPNASLRSTTRSSDYSSEGFQKPSGVSTASLQSKDLSKIAVILGGDKPFASFAESSSQGCEAGRNICAPDGQHLERSSSQKDRRPLRLPITTSKTVYKQDGGFCLPWVNRKDAPKSAGPVLVSYNQLNDEPATGEAFSYKRAVGDFSRSQRSYASVVSSDEDEASFLKASTDSNSLVVSIKSQQGADSLSVSCKIPSNFIDSTQSIAKDSMDPEHFQNSLTLDSLSLGEPLSVPAVLVLSVNVPSNQMPCTTLPYTAGASSSASTSVQQGNDFTEENLSSPFSSSTALCPSLVNSLPGVQPQIPGGHARKLSVVRKQSQSILEETEECV